MRKITLRVAVALAAIASTLAVAAPVQATPSTSGQVVTSPARVLDDGGRHRFRHRGRFPIVTPFLFGATPFFGGHGFRGGFDGGGCEIFLLIGDVQSYVLCRVG